MKWFEQRDNIHWQIAWKRRTESTFQLISNPAYGWCADPFLVKYHEELYLFAEIFLYKSERNGVIGYCQFEGEKWSDWTVTMDRHWHLSYPNVWVENDRLLMCPESYQLGEVAIYELEAFPDQWRKTKVLIDNVAYCDTTFLETEDEQYMITYDRGERASSVGRGLIFTVTEGHLSNKRVFSETREGNRCGGAILYSPNGTKIRVGQNGINGYGGGIIFFQIDRVEPIYKEHEIGRILPEDISVDSSRPFVGIHTYNTFGEMEVIDLKYTSRTINVIKLSIFLGYEEIS